MAKRRDRNRGPDEGVLAEGLGRAIKVLRTGQDLSRKDLANRAGLSYSYLAEIENGVKSPSSRALAAIAEGLGFPLHELLEAAATWRTSLSGVEALRPEAWVRRVRTDDRAADSDAAIRAEEAAPDYADSVDLMRAAEPSTRAARGLPEADLAARLSPPDPYPAEPRDRIPSDLLNEIHAGNCIAFVGAGFSAAADLPAWGDLLARVATHPRVSRETRTHVAERIDRGSAFALDEAAQVLEDEIGRALFLDQLEDHLGHPSITDAMAWRVRWLHGIPFRTILTTNFDGILRGSTTSHDAYRNALRPPEYRWWETRYWGEAEGAFTLKLHGDLSQSQPDETVVLTRRDYRRRLYEDPAYETFLRAVMATTTVLYLGFSFEDAYLNELRSEILALLGQNRESTPVAYAIVNDVPGSDAPATSANTRASSSSPTTRDSGTRLLGLRHATFERIYAATNPLQRFARYLEHKRILWVDPHPENNEEAFETSRCRRRRRSGREQGALVTADTADEGLHELEAAGADGPFDLAITHWGEDARATTPATPTPRRSAAPHRDPRPRPALSGGGLRLAAGRRAAQAHRPRPRRADVLLPLRGALPGDRTDPCAGGGMTAPRRDPAANFSRSSKVDPYTPPRLRVRIQCRDGASAAASARFWLDALMVG